MHVEPRMLKRIPAPHEGRVEDRHQLGERKELPAIRGSRFFFFLMRMGHFLLCGHGRE